MFKYEDMQYNFKPERKYEQHVTQQYLYAMGIANTHRHFGK